MSYDGASPPICLNAAYLYIVYRCKVTSPLMQSETKTSIMCQIEFYIYDRFEKVVVDHSTTMSRKSCQKALKDLGYTFVGNHKATGVWKHPQLANAYIRTIK